MKKLILIILLLIPFVVNAEEECNKEKHKEYLSLADNITYDNQYIKSENRFTITVYNLFGGMYAKYNETVYKVSSDNTITISKIPCGDKVTIDIYGNDNCSPVKRIMVKEPYYNKYYGSEKCKGYEDILLMCHSQFTNIEVSESLIDKAIYNYKHDISQKVTKDDKPEEEETILSKVTVFLTNWGLKILLAVISTILSISLFSDKYRKVKHGI